ALLLSDAALAHRLPVGAKERGGNGQPGMRLHAPQAGSAVLEDVYVLPRRPAPTRVRWSGYEFSAILRPHRPEAGARLYYYESEERAAEIAAAIIRDQYVRLSTAFEYVPERVIPYILYATQFEFQATNAFSISEGTLGVTSPADLTLSLPFFGDLEQYRHTSAHELAHEFTVQLVR